MKSFIKWCKDHRSEIYSGVLCTLITTALFKGADWIKNVVPSAGNSLVRALSDEFYQTLARQTDTTIITMLFSLAFGVYSVYTFSPMIKAFAETGKSMKVALEAANFDDTLGRMAKDAKNKPVKETRVSQETPEEKLIKEGKRLLRSLRKTRIILIACILFCGLYLVWILVYQIFPSSMWSIYQRDIVKITPYTEMYDLQMIQSDWACMQNKADYDDVYARINGIKEKNELP